MSGSIFYHAPIVAEQGTKAAPYDESERDDLRRLKEFVAQHGAHSIYQSAAL